MHRTLTLLAVTLLGGVASVEAQRETGVADRADDDGGADSQIGRGGVSTNVVHSLR